MEQILSLMALLGAFTFLSMGLCIANSIEAKESEKTSNIMVLGIASFLIGFFGLLIGGFFLLEIIVAISHNKRITEYF